MQKTSMLILIGILTILFSSAYVIFHGPTHPSENSFASLTPLIRQIMVVDINKTGNLTAEAVLAGQLPILGINEMNGPIDYQKIQLGFLDKVGRLFAYLKPNDYTINAVDPIFFRLVLVYMHSKKINYAIFIKDAGIRTIYLDKNHRTPTELFPGGPKGYWRVANTAVFADGTTRNIRVIPINSSDLPYH